LAMEIWWDWTVIRGVMFLFRGEFGCLMYTGDFRWEVDSKRAKDARSRLLNVLKNETVDSLYLDNMYCNPSYDFPTQEVTTQQVGFAYFLFT
jgi:DNA cross-link repair 1B protein